jgi:superfamily II DNA helicase RecQ
MQFKIFNIPVTNGESELEEMNKFLRGNKTLHVRQKLLGKGHHAFWSYSVSFLENAQPRKASTGKKPRIDYREVLDELTFARFTVLRTRRKQIADSQAVPAYVVFTNEELAEIAKLGEEVTPVQLTKVPGIGIQRAKKFGEAILQETTDETNR